MSGNTDTLKNLIGTNEAGKCLHNANCISATMSPQDVEKAARQGQAAAQATLAEYKARVGKERAEGGEMEVPIHDFNRYLSIAKNDLPENPFAKEWLVHRFDALTENAKQRAGTPVGVRHKEHASTLLTFLITSEQDPQAKAFYQSLVPMFEQEYAQATEIKTKQAITSEVSGYLAQRVQEHRNEREGSMR